MAMLLDMELVAVSTKSIQSTVPSPGFIGPWRKDHLRQRLVQMHTLRTGRMYNMNAVKAAASAVMVAQMRTIAVQIAPG